MNLKTRFWAWFLNENITEVYRVDSLIPIFDKEGVWFPSLDCEMNSERGGRCFLWNKARIFNRFKGKDDE